MNRTLYEINSRIREALEMGYIVDQETGEVIDSTPELLAALDMERAEKLENIALYVKDLDAMAEAMKSEEKALTARRKAKEARAERLRAMLVDDLQAHGQRKFEAPRVALSLRASKRLKIDEGATIPAQFMKVTTTEKTDAVGLKKALAGGAEFPGVSIETVNNLQIK